MRMNTSAITRAPTNSQRYNLSLQQAPQNLLDFLASGLSPLNAVLSVLCRKTIFYSDVFLLEVIREKAISQ